MIYCGAKCFAETSVEFTLYEEEEKLNSSNTDSQQIGPSICDGLSGPDRTGPAH